MRIKTIELANFRKLKSIRIEIGTDTTVFVGANNSGKTSAMLALRYFLMKKERSKISIYDFTLSNWIKIDNFGIAWEHEDKTHTPLTPTNWDLVLPHLDIWLNVDMGEVHHVEKLIPTLDWHGGNLGVRLILQPHDTDALQKDYLKARANTRSIQSASLEEGNDGNTENVTLAHSPQTLTDFLKDQKNFHRHFKVKVYLLDPTKLKEPVLGEAQPQVLPPSSQPINGEPFHGLIRIDEIGAQRGFGQMDGSSRDPQNSAGSSPTRKMSEQLQRYWTKHLDPNKNPASQDIAALRAISEAEKAFDARLQSAFAPAIKEVEMMGYPGVTDPKLKISTRLTPVDGLNHDTAVQYVVSETQDSSNLNLPETSNGLGYQNLISMVFRLMSFRDAWMRVGKASATDEEDLDEEEQTNLISPLHLVLIEEPEAHLHAQVQQVFIRQAHKILRKHPDLGESTARQTQVVVSTHSSHIANECEFEELRYFRRIPALEANVPLSQVINLGGIFGNDSKTKRFVTRYIRVTHCDLFFADAAVFVEGPAERILVPFFLDLHETFLPLTESYITWLDIGGSHAHRLRPLVESLGLTTLIITDLDACDENNKKVHPQRGKKQKTRNSTIKTWCPEKNDLDTLVDLPEENKSKSYESQHFSIRVAYQSPVTITFNNTEEQVLCNTLEDAIVMENHQLFQKTGVGLWKKFHDAIKSSKSPSELRDTVLKALESGAKAEFALDLLEISDPNALNIPLYIKNGLAWLVEQIIAKRQALGIKSIDDTEEVTPQ